MAKDENQHDGWATTARAFLHDLFRAFPDLPPFSRTLAAAAVLSFVGGVVLAFLFAWRADGVQLAFNTFAIAIASMLLLLTGAWLTRSASSTPPAAIKAEPAAAGASRTRARWERTFVRSDLSPDELGTIASSIRDLHARILTILESAGHTYTNSLNLRLQIFLPQFDRLAAGEVCALSRPEVLAFGRFDEPETRLRLQPNQGLVGWVFSYETPLGVRPVIRDDQRIWTPIEILHMPPQSIPADFNLSPLKDTLIPDNFRWGAAFPLSIQSRSEGRAFGVMFLDDLEHNLPDEQIKRIGKLLITETGLISSMFDQFKWSTIAIVESSL